MNRHNEAFGKALREFRQAINLSQEALGFKAQLDRTYISLLELGQRSPTLDTVMALCEALNITIVELISAVTKHMVKNNE